MKTFPDHAMVPSSVPAGRRGALSGHWQRGWRGGVHCGWRGGPVSSSGVQRGWRGGVQHDWHHDAQ